jgi:HAD superfamily hydrolase (TIGR01509 family)
MVLKAILFDFNGVIINDESIHQESIAEILLRENLRPEPSEFSDRCIGKRDRDCLKAMLDSRGRVVSDEYLSKLIISKSEVYRQKLADREKLPIYPEIAEYLAKLSEQDLIIGLVTGAGRAEVEMILQRAEIAKYFTIIVAGDDVSLGKPDPEGYLLAVELLNQKDPNLNLEPLQCLAIEDSYPGIEAAKKAGMQVVGIANTYPLHMLQRRANWTVDYLSQIELDRVERILSQI